MPDARSRGFSSDFEVHSHARSAAHPRSAGAPLTIARQAIALGCSLRKGAPRGASLALLSRAITRHPPETADGNRADASQRQKDIHVASLVPQKSGPPETRPTRDVRRQHCAVEASIEQERRSVTPPT